MFQKNSSELQFKKMKTNHHSPHLLEKEEYWSITTMGIRGVQFITSAAGPTGNRSLGHRCSKHVVAENYCCPVVN
jgi:hypothetical protein